MKLLLLFLWVGFFFSIFSSTVLAIEDPRTKPNNRFGIHILFPAEIEAAAKLVNSNGGDWGYVIIPIQSGDKDIEKWQKFMDDAKRLHLIPIIRLATEGDYFNTKVWRKPKYTDINDFALFLDSLYWPTQNRYIVVYNEVNRGDEWGGAADPQEYADILDYAITFFKTVHPDFFIIASGMDNAAPNQGSEYIDQYTFYRAMHATHPGLFKRLDGMASHAYPNPSFAQPPTVRTSKSIVSYQYEKQLLDSFAEKDLPVFITETGWSLQFVSEPTMAQYYKDAFSDAWNHTNIVAITPFLLKASGPFAPFAFIKEDGSETERYKTFFAYRKQKGAPTLTTEKPAPKKTIFSGITERKFDEHPPAQKTQSRTETVQTMLKWLLKI